LAAVGEGDISDTDSQRSDNEDAKSPMIPPVPVRTQFSPPVKQPQVRAPVRAQQPQQQLHPQPQQIPQQVPQTRLQSPIRGPASYNFNTPLQGVVGTTAPTVSTPARGRAGLSSGGPVYTAPRQPVPTGLPTQPLHGGGGAYSHTSPYGAAMAGAYLHAPAYTPQQYQQQPVPRRPVMPAGSPSRNLYEDQEEVEPAFSWFEQLRTWDVPEADASRIAECLEGQGYEEQDIDRLTREDLTHLPTTIKGAHITRILDGVKRHKSVRTRK
jgi:hypothetical protein